MSRGRQHHSWSERPEHRVLMDKITKAHFHHYLSGRDYGLTYQSCRFCGTACFRNEDTNHGACSIREGEVFCQGLWKYGVRHYVCSDCRKNILVGLAPRKKEDIARKHSKAAGGKAHDGLVRPAGGE